MKIIDILLKNNITPDYKGFDYLINAINYTVDYKKTNRVYPQMTRDVYPAVAKMFRVTPSKVERSIRHIIGKIQIKDIAETGRTNGGVISYFAYLELNAKKERFNG